MHWVASDGFRRRLTVGLIVTAMCVVASGLQPAHASARETGTSHLGASQTGTSHLGTSQTGTSHLGTSQTVAGQSRTRRAATDQLQQQQVARAAQGLVAAVVQVRLMGRSVQGRPLLAYRLGDPSSPTKIVILGQMHGNEPAGVTAANAMISGLPIAGVDLWVIPTMNPDGAAAGTRVNADGVDLNRNWPDYWAPLTGDFYSGPGPLSEPETVAMLAFLRQVRPRYLISIHQPLDGVDTTDGGARNPGFSQRLAANLGLAQKPFRCFSFCHGSMTGWLTNRTATDAITVEFGWGVSQSYLVNAVPGALLRSLPPARVANAADRNPITSITAGVTGVSTNGGPGAVAPRGHTGSTVTITGTAFDPDARLRRTAVRITEAGRTVWHGITAGASPRLNKAQVLTGPHGFSASFTALPGVHRYCAVGVNVGPGTARATPQCATIRVDGRAFGQLETLTVNADATVTVVGWAVDPNRSASPVRVTVARAGMPATSSATMTLRPEVNSHYRITGTHGFAVTVPAQPAAPASAPSADPATYCVSIGAPAVSLGCHQNG